MFPHLSAPARPHRPARTPAATAALAVFLAAAPLWAAEPAREPLAALPAESQQFTSSGRTIRLDRWTAPGPRPVLLVLHAVDGADGADGLVYRAFARDYASAGYDVGLVHYFDATGAAPADLAAYRYLFTRYYRSQPGADERALMGDLLAAWTRAAVDAVAWVHATPNREKAPVALVGFSLGGAVALAAAGHCQPPPAAVVDLFGTLPWELRGQLTSLPPTLILHGTADRIVPVDEVYRLTGWLVSRRQRPELVVYPGADHLFFRDGTAAQLLPMILAHHAVAAHLHRHTPVTPTLPHGPEPPR